MEGFPLAVVVLAEGGTCSINLAGNVFSGYPRLRVRLTWKFVPLVRMLATPSSAKMWCGKTSTSSVSGATYVSVHPPSVILWPFQRIWGLLSFLLLNALFYVNKSENQTDLKCEWSEHNILVCPERSWFMQGFLVVNIHSIQLHFQRLIHTINYMVNPTKRPFISLNI